MTGNEAITRTESEEKPAVHLAVKFRIEQFETLMKSYKPGKDLWSEGDTSKLAPRPVWRLRVWPNSWREQDKDNITVYLCLRGPMMDNKETLDTTCHIYLVDGSGGGKIDVVGRRIKNFGENGYYGLGENVTHDRVKKAMHADGSLLVAADVEFLAPDDFGGMAICKASALQGYQDREKWATKFSELHGDVACSDCSIQILQIGGVSIPAHKCILVAQSPIFRSMFTHREAEEFQSSVVKVTDFNEPEPMRALVRYCYQGFLDDSTMDGEGAVEIFKLADRYCIKELKSVLERHFVEKRLGKENVVAMAVLADTYTAPKLKEACLKLIARAGDPIFESADWKKVEETRPKLAVHLAVETIRVLNTKG